MLMHSLPLHREKRYAASDRFWGLLTPVRRRVIGQLYAEPLNNLITCKEPMLNPCYQWYNEL